MQSLLRRLLFLFMLGMVLGPAMGGWLGATGDYYFAAKLSAVGSLISVGLSLLMPSSLSSLTAEKTTTLPGAVDMKASIVTSASSSLSEVYSTLVKIISAVGLLLSTKILTGVANAMNGSTQPLILKDIYKFRETDLGLYMSISSVLNTVLSGFMLGPIIKIGFKNNMLLAVSTSLLSMTLLSFLLSAFTSSLSDVLPFNILNGVKTINHGLYSYVVISYVLSVFQYILSTTLTSESTQRVHDREKGTLLGLEHSLFAAARVFAPYMGISVLKQGGISGVAAVTGAGFGVIYLLWSFFLYTLPSLDRSHANGSGDGGIKKKPTSAAVGVNEWKEK